MANKNVRNHQPDYHCSYHPIAIPPGPAALMAVDLPAPLAPITATRETCETVKLTSMMVGLSCCEMLGFTIQNGDFRMVNSLFHGILNGV